MTQTLRVTYLSCGFCAAKNRCEACGADLAAALLRREGISEAAVNIPDRTLRITHALDGDALEDLLDGMGLLAE